jgi:hypothetical protein
MIFISLRIHFCKRKLATGLFLLLGLITSETLVASTSILKNSLIKSPFTSTVRVLRVSSLYDLNNGEKFDSVEYNLGFKYALTRGSLSSQLGYSQNLNNDQSSAMSDSNLTFTDKSYSVFGRPKVANMTWVPSATLIIPISEQSREVEQLHTATIAGVGFALLADAGSSWSGLGSELKLTLGKNFHQFETDKNGVILNNISSNQSLGLFYSINGWSFSLGYAHRIRWPYAGEAKQSFELSQDVTYSSRSKWSVSLGHTNSGASLKPNGQDSNVALIDEEGSAIYLGFALSN